MDMIEARRRILLNTPHLVATTPAPVASFDTDMVGKLRSAKFAFTPVQSGSGDPSPTNVRPISGWDGLTVTRCGKNLFNDANYDAGVLVPLRLAIGTKVAASAKPNINAMHIRYYNKNRVQIDYWQLNYNSTLNRSARSFTIINEDCEYMAVTGTDVSEIQVELGETPTPYAPYTGSTYPVSWQSEAGTVYGGYVDVVKGEVVATHAKGMVNTSTAGAIGITGDGRIVVGYPAMKSGASQFGVCNVFATYTAGGQNPMMQFGAGNTNLVIYNCSSIWPTVEDFKAYINANTVEIAYPIPTPITYSITPQIIKSLKGANNMWSTGNGDTTITYWTH